MATHLKSFDDAYLTTCTTCDESLEWEWDADTLAFEATCGCLKKHRLVPMQAELEVVDEGIEDDLGDDYED